ARTDAQAYDVRLAGRLLVHRAQHLYLGPGAGVGLKVGEIARRAIDALGLQGQLFADRVLLLRFVGKRRDVTEGAAAAPDGAIAIGAAEAAVQRELMNFLAVASGEIAAKHID